MADASNTQPDHMNTSQQINHIYRCRATNFHLIPGFKLLKAGDITHCTECGAEVYDVTDTPMGQYYIAFARIDKGEKPA